MTEVTRVSMFDGRVRTRDIPGLDPAALAAYENAPRHLRPLIQNAFPQLSPAAREFIKTGDAGEEWADMFGGSVCGDCNGMGMEVGRTDAQLCTECGGAGYFRRVEESDDDNYGGEGEP